MIKYNCYHKIIKKTLYYIRLLISLNSVTCLSTEKTKQIRIKSEKIIKNYILGYNNAGRYIMWLVK